MSIIDTRRDQMFPKLSRRRSSGCASSARSGAMRRATRSFTTGEAEPRHVRLLSGPVAVSWRDGLGHVLPIIELGPVDFLAEVGAAVGPPLARRCLCAKSDVEAL